MKLKHLALLLWLTIGTTLFAAAQATSYDFYKALNESVNKQIAASELRQHRLVVNTDGQNFGSYRNYTENISFYFDMNNNVPTLKKIIVLTDVMNRKEYADYLFHNGELGVYDYNYDLNNAESSKIRAVFGDRKLKQLIAKDQQVNEDRFTEEHVRVGIDVLTKAIRYKAIFDAIVNIHPK